MSALSENTIKQITLGYLRSFYRHRKRGEGSTLLTGLDMRGTGGIIADGFLHYTTDEGKVYSVTFEATSFATRDEILYRPRKSHVFWDALAFAFLFLPALLAIAHISKYYPLVGMDFYRRLLILLSTLPLWVALYFVLFRRLPRYRYIFAVEQFKQYHADDQWIAYGYDVFSDKRPKYRNQLLKQCTRYGFGLIEITAQRKPKLIMAPSFAVNFLPQKGFMRFLPLQQWQERISNMAKGPWQLFKAFLRKQFLPVQNRYFKWFPRTYYQQWVLTFCGMIITFLFIRSEYQRLPIIFANESRYKKNVLAEREGKRPESEYYKVDAPVPGFYDTTFSPYEIRFNEEQFQGLVQSEAPDQSENFAVPSLRIIYAEPGAEAALYYSCDRYNALNRQFYLITDTTFRVLTRARERMEELNDRGLPATAVWPPCLGINGDGYLIYVDEILLDSTAAIYMRDSLQNQLDTLDRQLRVLKYYPLTNSVN